MAENNATATANGGGLGGLLLVVLVVLKLNPGGHLDSPVEDWSWWLVIFAPLLIALAVILVVLALIAVIWGGAAGVIKLLDKRSVSKARKKREKMLEQRKLRADRPTDLK